MDASDEATIAGLSAVDLLHAMSEKELSCRQVIEALRGRSERLNGLLGAIVVPRYEQALQRADAIDKARSRGETLPPLAGLPITIKENIDLAGTASTMGVVARRTAFSTSDSVLTAALQNAGAIVIGKTNVPQLLLAQETENAIWGRTRNPWKLSHSVGGSSGGEAAAIAAGLSPFGIGTDIGGSIRIPAHFCGIAGLKPTVDRWSNKGIHGALPGQELVRSQIGPMARHVGDLIAVSNALNPVAMSRFDPAVAPLPIDDASHQELTGLRIGWFDDDGFLAPTPSQRRAVARAREVLTKAGAELVPITPEGNDEIMFLWLAALSGDGGKTLRRCLDGETFIAPLKRNSQIARLPAMVRHGLSQLVSLAGQDRLARLLTSLGEKSVQEIWDLTARRTLLRRREHDVWRSAAIDAMICPAHAIPAMPHGVSADLTLSLSYSFRYTFLNFPAGVVPVTRVSAQDISSLTSGDEGIERKLCEVERAAEGLPVAVQVVAPPFREDMALAVMATIEALVRDDSSFPTTPVSPTA